MYVGGECGNPSRQTCSKLNTQMSHLSTNLFIPTSRAKLFAEYVKDYTDAAGRPHALCPGSDKCCGGGVWGDVMPAGKSLLLLNTSRLSDHLDLGVTARVITAVVRRLRRGCMRTMGVHVLNEHATMDRAAEPVHACAVAKARA